MARRDRHRGCPIRVPAAPWPGTARQLGEAADAEGMADRLRVRYARAVDLGDPRAPEFAAQADRLANLARRLRSLNDA